MSLKEWEAKVLDTPGANERVRDIEDELRLAAGLTALREQAGLSQRELAQRIGVSQPRIAAIERSRNVTIDILEQYVGALGARLEISVVRGHRRTALVGGRPQAAGTRTSTGRARATSVQATKRAASRSTGARGQGRSRITQPIDRAQNKAIREWARSKKKKISDRGRIPDKVVAEYQASAGR